MECREGSDESCFDVSVFAKFAVSKEKGRLCNSEINIEIMSSKRIKQKGKIDALGRKYKQIRFPK